MYIPPIVSHPATDDYRANWASTFGKKKKRASGDNAPESKFTRELAAAPRVHPSFVGARVKRR